MTLTEAQAMTPEEKRVKLAGTMKIGRLHLIKKSHLAKNRAWVWLCQCDCGGLAYVQSGDLLSGHTKSCGCLRREKTASERLTHGSSRRGKHTKEYRAWSQMLSRCNNPKNRAYRHYGGRGIRVCTRWLDSFPSFLEDMGEAPEGMSLDRKDNDWNYEPTNCRWATKIVQAQNRRSSIRIEINGVTRTASEWADMNGIPRKTAYDRITYGWDAKRAVTEPKSK